jgi:hypothetical protein
MVMNRPISTRSHGAIDHAWSAAAADMSQRLAGAPRTSSLLRRASDAARGTSMVTRYEMGVVPILPMKGHLAFDFVVCAALLASPLFLPAAERRHALIPVAFGVAGLLVALLTQPRSPLERQPRGTLTSTRG